METQCKQCGQTLISGPEESLFCPSCAMDKFLDEDGDVPTLIAESPVSAKGRTVVQGHELIEELARGGMGVVYRARQLSPRRDVALKMLLPGADRVDEFQERFRLEARALAELDHPSILPLYMAGEQDGVPFFTMKLALGGSLAQLLKKGKKLDFKTVANLIATLAEAVFYANQRGILHRDIKPGNILFDENQNPFLADFGLAKLIGGNPANTMSMGAMGTPCYMAPEVAARGASCATASSDVYGLGAVLYELLAGKPPFQVEGLAAILKKVAEEAPEAPSTLAKGVPRDLEVICLTCLAKEPKKRYLTAQALAEDLQRWLKGEPITARRVGPAERLWSWAKRYPGLAGMSAALLVTLSAGSAWLWVQNRSLDSALIESQLARVSEGNREDFLLGQFGDELEDIGRLSLLHKVWQDIDNSYLHDPRSKIDAVVLTRHSRLLTRWAGSLLLAGESDKAIQKAQEAVTSAKSALGLAQKDSSGGSTSQKITLAQSLAREAEACGAVGDFTTAEQRFNEVEKLMEQIPNSEVIPEKINLLLSHSNVFSIASDDAKTGKLVENSTARAVALAREWIVKAPSEFERKRILASALRRFASAKFLKNGLANRSGFFNELECSLARESVELYREAEAIYKALVSENLNNQSVISARLRHESNYVQQGLAYLFLRIPDRLADAKIIIDENLKICSDLHQQDKLSLRWASDYADALGKASDFFGKVADHVAEERYRKEATEAAAAIVEIAPTIRGNVLQAQRNFLSQGNRSLEQRRIPEALASYNGALKITKAYLQKAPASFSDQKGWHDLVEGICERLREAEQITVATDIYRDAVAFTRTLESSNMPEGWQWTRAKFHRRLATLLAGANEILEAQAENRIALQLRLQLVKSRWSLQNTEGDAANSILKIVETELEASHYEEALNLAELGIQLKKEIPEMRGEPYKWGVPILKIAQKVIPLGGPLEARIRSLARNAFSVLYHNATAPTGKEDAKISQALEKLGQDFSP